MLRALVHADLSGFSDGDASGFDAAAVALEGELADVRARLLSLVEDGDTAAVGRYRDLAVRASKLEREVAAARSAARAAGATPSWQERARMLADLTGWMAKAEGDERRAIRTEVAQVLRTTLACIVFGRHRIEGHYHDARLRYRTERVVARPGEKVAAYKIKLFLDAPVFLDAEDIAMLESVPRKPLPARWGTKRSANDEA